MEKIAQEDRLQILKASQAKLKVRDDPYKGNACPLSPTANST